MKIWTSYYAKIKELQANGFTDFIAISGWLPDFYKKLMINDPEHFRRIIELSPKKEWFFEWKNGKINNDDYIKLYHETVLNKLDFGSIINQLKENSVLLCYEKPEDFCHRHLIAKWLNENKINCREFDFNLLF